MFKCGVNSLKSNKVRSGKSFPKGIGRPWSVIFILLFTALCLNLTALVNQELEKPDSLFLGTRFILKITADKDLTGIIAPDTLTKYAIIDTQVVKSAGKKDGLKLTIAALDTGSHTFPSLIIIPAKFGEAQLQSRPFTLTINEIRASGDTLLADIADTVKLKGEMPLWAYYVLIALLILILLTAVFFLARRFLKKKVEEFISPSPVTDDRPNWKRALDELKALMNQELPEGGQYIAFHYRLSEIMKLYLEAEFRFSANEMTTREIRQYIKKQEFLSLKDQKEIIDWLENCDRIKFAKIETTPEASYQLLDWFALWLTQKGANTDRIETQAVADA